MQYIEDNGNRLIVKKVYENQSEGSYWIAIHFKSMPKKDLSIYSRNMSMQVFVRDGNIINRSITIKETPHIVSVTAHNHEDREGFDESFITIDYNDIYTENKKYNGIYTESKKHDEVILDNAKINDEEEEILIEELLKNNNIGCSIEPFMKLFHMSLEELNNLIRDDSCKEDNILKKCSIPGEGMLHECYFCYF